MTLDKENPPSVFGMCEALPEDGWTAEERERFLAAFVAVLDFAIPIRERARADDTHQETE